MSKSNIFGIIVLVILLGVVFNVRSFVLGGATPVSLASAAPLTSQISQAFTTGGNTAIPVAGKDYSLENTKYFDNNEWVVTTIKPLDQTVTDGVAVLQKKSGIYIVTLGPGTAFPDTSLQNMPADLAKYLNETGLIYESNAE